MPSVLILADDLSGAAELAGLAYGHGFTAQVQRQIDPSSSASVIAIDTDSRQRTAEAAAGRLRDLATRRCGLENTILYKKTDSLLRGNVRAEIEALMQAAGYRRMILIPANPSRGRTVRGGRYFIDGQPLDQTSLASDPHHPRHSASVLELLGPGDQPVHIAPALTSLPSTGIIIPDATSLDDLAALASQVDEHTLPAGAADYFQTLLKTRAHPSHPSDPCPIASLIEPPALLVCGSRLAWPDRRAAAQRASIPVLEAETGAGVIDHARAYALGFGDRVVVPQKALEIVGSLAAQMITSLNIKTILVEGGETAAALAVRLDWRQFEVVADAPAGLGALRPLVENAPLVITKPGSYSWPDEIWQVFQSL